VATALNDPDRPRDDLSRLNDAERQVLRLLAEGHTAKSIANTIGCSAAAVNERLREARRKTGVGSSRELARLLKAQENRDKLIGVAGRRLSRPLLSLSAAEPWRPQTGVLTMIAIFLVAAAGSATLISQAPPSSSEVDPLIGAPVERFNQPAGFYAKVRAEKRDPEWAPRVEAAVRARLMQIPVIGKDGNVLRVTCAATLCEIAGSLIGARQPPREYDPNLPVNRAQSDLQDKPLNDDLAKLGLKSEGGSFTTGKGKPDRGVFLIYYSRAK